MNRWHWSPGRRNAVSIAVAALALAGLAVLRLADPSAVRDLRYATFDAYQRVAPRPYGDPPVRIADIDEASLAAYGQWPWPRTRIAELNDRLKHLGAAAVAYDVIFAEPDRTSPARYAAEVERHAGSDGDAVRALLAHLPDHDEILAASLKASPSILAFALADKPTGRRPALKSGLVHLGHDPAGILPPARGAVPPIGILEAAAAGVGGIGERNATGVIRRVPLLYAVDGAVHPSLVVEALRVAQGAGSTRVRTTGASGEALGDTGRPALVDLKVGDARVPLTADGQMWIRYDRDRPERFVSVRDILDPDKETDVRPRIEGQVVFVGASVAGLLDLRTTALGEKVAGVSVHAQAVEQILAGDFLARPDWSEPLEAVATVLLGALVAALLLVLGAKLALAAGLLAAAGAVGASWAAFAHAGLLLDPVYPSLAALAVHLLVTGVLYVSTDGERRFVRRAFGQYLAPELLAKLERQPRGLVLGGEMREMSIMFMDVRGFTPISETLSATDLVHFLNTLLSPLSEAIQAQDGTIDKYIGDSIMAFWNAPVDVEDHAARACRAALRMGEIVREMNERDAFGFRAMGRRDLTVRIGVGINTGEACVGNMGSERRFNYSVIGDAVNTAARIEASCKAVGADLLVSEETMRAAPGFAVLEAGRVALKGKARPAALYALVGDESLGASAAFREFARLHERLIAAIDGGDAQAASVLVALCRRAAPVDLDAFYDRFDETVRGIGSAPAEPARAAG